MSKNLASFSFFPSTTIGVAFQVGHSLEYVQVHKQKIVGSIKQFVPMFTFVKCPS